MASVAATAAKAVSKVATAASAASATSASVSASKRTFSDSVLNLVRVPKPYNTATDFLPFYRKMHWHDPKFSPRRQAMMRKACIAEGIDPASIGLPPKMKKHPIQTQAPEKTKREVEREKRAHEVAIRMEKMPEMVKQWREEKKKSKMKARPPLPF